MSARSPATPPDCRLDRAATEPMLEFAAFGFPLGGAFVVGWPAAPGAVRHDEAGHPVLLHFAPARWLAPAPHPDIPALHGCSPAPSTSNSCWAGASAPP